MHAESVSTHLALWVLGLVGASTLAAQTPREGTTLLPRDSVVLGEGLAAVSVVGAPVSLRMVGTECMGCEFDAGAVVHNAVIRRSTFDHTTFRQLSLTASELTDVTIVNSRIARLDISRSEVNRLRIVNSRVDTLTVDKSTVGGLTLWGLDVGTITVSNVTGGSLVAWALGGGGLLEVDGGRWERLDMDRPVENNVQVSLAGAIVTVLRVTPRVVEHLDARRVGNRPGTVRLQQEVDALESSVPTPQRTRLLVEAQLMYGELSSRFEEAGLGRHQRETEYRMRLMELSTVESKWERRFLGIWHLHLRGRFGLSPIHVLGDALLAALLFGFVFFLMGVAGFAWGAILPADLLGNPRAAAKPRLITPGRAVGWLGYAMHCWAFSLDRLLFAGTRLFQIDELFDNLRVRPARYVPAGLGRVFAGVEGVLGLVLLVNFVQAVVRVV